VLFERVCREHGITAKLTRPYSPTTTGKVERWHRTLRRELLDVTGPFADLPSAQAAITAWVHACNHQRPHQALGMATPASLFRPGSQPELAAAVPAPRPAPEPACEPAGPVLLGAHSAGAVEFDTVISPSGVLGVIPAVQRIKMGAERAGQLAHVWADEFSIHVLIGGQLVKTVPSSLNAEDLATLKMRGAAPAGPPPAAPAPAKAGTLPGGTVIEADRAVDGNGSPTWPASGSKSARSWPAAGSRSGSTGTSSTSSATAPWPRPWPAPSRPPAAANCAAPASPQPRCRPRPPAPSASSARYPATASS
jgi:hypothetical protein